MVDWGGDEITVHNTEEGVHIGCDWDTYIWTEELCGYLVGV